MFGNRSDSGKNDDWNINTDGGPGSHLFLAPVGNPPLITGQQIVYLYDVHSHESIADAVLFTERVGSRHFIIF